jgi:hypothetical protein
MVTVNVDAFARLVDFEVFGMLILMPRLAID